MSSKVIRVSEEALAVTEQYSPDTSTAILLMQAKLEEREKQLNNMKAIEKVIKNTISDSLADLGRGY